MIGLPAITAPRHTAWVSNANVEAIEERCQPWVVPQRCRATPLCHPHAIVENCNRSGIGEPRSEVDAVDQIGIVVESSAPLIRCCVFGRRKHLCVETKLLKRLSQVGQPKNARLEARWSPRTSPIVQLARSSMTRGAPASSPRKSASHECLGHPCIERRGGGA